MRRRRMPKDIDPTEIPDHLRAYIELHPEYANAGASTDPADNIWRGHNGEFDIDQGLAVDRDPEDALTKIVRAIVFAQDDGAPDFEREARVRIAVAKILGRKQRPGPKAGEFAKVNKMSLLRRAAYLVYERRLEPERGASNWKPCLWDALTDKERKIFDHEYAGEKFNNFYNDCIKLLERDNLENNLLFEASVHDKKTGEPTLDEWRWRQGKIDRIIGDMTALGLIPRKL